MMLLKSVIFLCVLLNRLSFIGCANILIVSPTPMYSHHIAFLEVWKTLHERGHNITFLTAFPLEENEKNITQVDISYTRHVLENPKYSTESMSKASKWSTWGIYFDLVLDIQEVFMSSQPMQDIIHNPNEYKFDAIISEVWYTNILALSKIYNCPSIVFATIEVYEALHWHLGNQINHITLPELNFGLYEASNIYERTESALFTLYEMIKEYSIYMYHQNTFHEKFFGKYVDATVLELKQDIDLLMINANPFLKGVRAVGPTTIMVGGGNHINPPKSLPQDLKLFLDNAETGFIYISFGSIVTSKDINNRTLTTIVEVFDNLPYKILWKFATDDFPKIPINAKIIKWAPQQDILRHPNIKLFISQGGIQSLEETIFSHVPVLIMPFFGDQHKNGQIAQSKGFGKMIQHKPKLDAMELESTIHELIKNPVYKNTAKRLATLMNDTYMTGLEKSIWWIEYVIRNNGTSELRNPSAKLPYYQYFALDIIGFLLAVVALLVLAIIVIIRCVSAAISSIVGKSADGKIEKQKMK